MAEAFATVLFVMTLFVICTFAAVPVRKMSIPPPVSWKEPVLGAVLRAFCIVTPEIVTWMLVARPSWLMPKILQSQPAGGVPEYWMTVLPAPAPLIVTSSLMSRSPWSAALAKESSPVVRVSV